MTRAELITAYRRDGFAIARQLFSAAEIDALLDAFNDLATLADGLVVGLPDGDEATPCMHRGAQFVLSRDGTRARIHRVVWCGAASPPLLNVGADPRILQLTTDALGHDEFDQLISQAHFKMPGDDVAFPWHQDSVHRRYGTPLWTDVDGDGSYVQVALALDPVTADNGPLAFIPQSHHHGHIPPPTSAALPASSFDASRAVTPTLMPGDVVLFGPYTIHGSGPNLGDRPRRVLVNGYASPGANRRVYPGEGSGRRLRVDGASPS